MILRHLGLKIVLLRKMEILCLNTPSGNPEASLGGNASGRLHNGPCIQARTEDFPGGRGLRF